MPIPFRLSPSLKRTPNRSRLAYDTIVLVAATLFVYEFSQISLKTAAGPELFVAPLVFLAVNYLAGVYTRFRVGPGLQKGLLFGLTVSASATLLYFLGCPSDSLMLLAILAWITMALPRIFLNLNNRVGTSNFVKTAIQSNGPVLVVGGGGYIGTHVIQELLGAGHRVRILDRFLYGKDSIQEFIRNPYFEFVEGDATDITKLIPAMDGVRAVVHLAGLVGDPACAVDEAFTRHVNIISTRMVKEMAVSYRIPRFIFASSCSVYGLNENQVDEESELNPVSLYAKTKIDSEKELLLCPADDFSATVLRFATVFGHSRRPRFDLVANLFTATAMTEGKINLMGPQQWRPFVHVKDLARAIRMVLEADENKVRSQIFNVGDSRLNMTIGDVANTVQKLVSPIRNVEINNVPSTDLRNYSVSFDKIKNILGFQASVSMADGVSEIIKEFQKGTYKNYRESKYSNLETTKIAVEDFRDPIQSSKLYRPVSDSHPTV